MQSSQWCFNMALVAWMKTLVLWLVSVSPAFSAAFALKKTSLSGSSALIIAEVVEKPHEVQNSALHPADTFGTKKRLTTAAIRYPTAYPCWRKPLVIPRASTGRFSSAVAAARPHIPPIPTPNIERRARNWWKVWTKLTPISRDAMSKRLQTRGHFLPKRSDRMPKITWKNNVNNQEEREDTYCADWTKE